MKTNSVRGYKDNTEFIAIHINFCSLSVPFVVFMKTELTFQTFWCQSSDYQRSNSAYQNNIN